MNFYLMSVGVKVSLRGPLYASNNLMYKKSPHWVASRLTEETEVVIIELVDKFFMDKTVPFVFNEMTTNFVLSGGSEISYGSLQALVATMGQSPDD